MNQLVYQIKIDQLWQERNEEQRDRLFARYMGRVLAKAVVDGHPEVVNMERSVMIYPRFDADGYYFVVRFYWKNA